MKNKILFIGTFAGKKYLNELLNTNMYYQTAANQTEEYYIKGLCSIVGKIDVISALVLPSYPKCSAKHINYNVEECNTYKVENVGFNNLPAIRIISQIFALSRVAKLWAKNNNDKHPILIVYSMRLPFLIAAKKIKKMNSKTTIVNIIPDLPDFMHNGKISCLKRAVIFLNKIALRYEQKLVDGYVLYTKSMEEYLPRAINKSILIEGIIDARQSDNFCRKEREKKIVFYAGGIDEKYGIRILVDGFIKAEIPNSELIICGLGDFANELSEIARTNHRIKYLGLISPEESKKMMKASDLLVNPRPTTGLFTRYSCPSKTLEYMASGVPVLTTRLEGIPNEYFEYVYTISEETSDGIAVALKSVFENEEQKRIELATRAQKYILENKNYYSQARKLYNFANKL